MAQLVVRNLEENVKRKLQRRARQSGRSLEGEVREILRAAAAENPHKTAAPGFGTRFAAYFRNVGVDLGSLPPETPSAAKFE